MTSDGVLERVMRLLSFLWVLAAAFPLTAGTLEIDSFTLQSTFTTPSPTNVTFSSPFPITPAVFASPSIQGGDPSDLRLVSVGLNGFSVLQVEPPRNDGPHVAMTSSYIAATPGVHTIDNGTSTLVYEVFCIDTQAEVSQQQGIGAAVTLNFSHAFSQRPNIIAEIQTLNSEANTPPSTPSSPFASAGVLNVSATQITLAIERSETDENLGAGSSITSAERICYLAIEPGRIALAEPGCNATIASTNATNIRGFGNTPQCRQIDFGATFSSPPLVVVDKTQRTDNDGGWARICATNASGPTVTIDQDRTGDNERNHSAVRADAVASSNTCRLEVATPVVIDEVIASPTEIAFSTLSERGALTFSVERYVPGQGFLPVHSRPIEAAWTKAEGGQYTTPDPFARRYGIAKRIRIIEFDHHGRRRSYGPFTPHKISREKIQPAQTHPLLELRATLTPPRRWSFSPGRKRIDVTRAGVYRVDASRVPNLNQIELTLDGEPLQAFSYRGELLFHIADDVRLPNVVFATGEGEGAKSVTLAQRQRGIKNVYRSEVREEKNLPVVTLAHEDNEDYWYWTGLLGSVAERAHLSVSVNPLAYEHVVSLKGANRAKHRILLGDHGSFALKDFDRGAVTLSARDAIDISLESQKSALLIDKIESRFRFTGDEAYAHLTATRKGAFEAKGYLRLNKAGESVLQNERFVVVRPEALLETRSVTNIGSDSSLSHDDEYLAIAPRAFKAALAPLLVRRGQSMSVRFVAAEDIAAHEGDFYLSARSLGRFIKKASPAFVLLVGDGTLDPEGHLFPQAAPLPVKMVGTSAGVFASDQAMIDSPSMAIGRVPARNVEEVQSFVAKTLAFDARGKHAFVADSADSGGDFVASTARVAKVVQSDRIFQIDDIEPRGVLGSQNAFVHFIGHGASDRLSKTRWLHNDDVAELDSAPSSPVLVAASCLVNRFELPTSVSLGERLLLAPEAGASAVISVGGYSYDGSFNQWHRAFAAALQRVDTVGEAMVEANRSMRDMMGDLGYLKTISLLGDPALASR